MLRTMFEPGVRIGTDNYTRSADGLDRLAEDMHAAYRLGFDFSVTTERHRTLPEPGSSYRQTTSEWTLTIYEPIVWDDATGHPVEPEAVTS